MCAGANLQQAALGVDVAAEQGLGVLALGHIQLGVAQVEDPPPWQEECSLQTVLLVAPRDRPCSQLAVQAVLLA